MSISVMNEGEVMGRGIKNPKLEARVRARRKAGGSPGAPVVILGAGPAGLLAAHAVALAGGDPVIFSRSNRTTGEAQKSAINGAIFLHEPIPDLTSAKPDGVIQFVKVGTRENYALKVYGSRFAPCSWDKFDEGERPAWALQPVYEDLWERYSGKIIPLNLEGEELDEIVENFPSIISTIPGYALCTDRGAHSFASKPIWITPHVSSATRVLQETYGKYKSLIAYDGSHPNMGSSRYRASIIFGHESTEYATEVGGAIIGQKITAPTDCNCRPEIVRAGRWGEWKPGVLVHHAFNKVWEMMFDTFEGVE